jgi:ATP-binding cassette, subfamily B, bacterial
MKKSYIDPRDVEGIDRGMLRRILGYLRPYSLAATGVVALIVGTSLLDLVPSLLIKQVLNEAIPDGNLRLLILLALAMVLAPFAADILGMGQKLLTTWLGETVMLDMRVDLFRHFNQESLGFFAAIKPGEAISRVLNDVEGVGSVVQGTLFDITDDLIVLATTVAALFWLDWRLALIGVAVMPVFILPSRSIGRKRKAVKRQTQARRAELTGILSETLSVSGTMLLKVFGAEDIEIDRFARKAREIVSLTMRQTLLGQEYRVIVGLFKNLAPAIVFGLGGYMVIRGQLEVGTLVAFVTLLKRAYGPASSLAGVQVDLLVSYAYFERIFAVLDHEPEIRNAKAAHRLRGVRGEIAFRDVSFSYDEDDATLRHIDLVIKPGQTVALVGPSGGGKSTLAALVPRLYDPTEGSVLLDGGDLRTIDLNDLRSHIGVVAQETYLFHTSVLENIRYGRPTATLDDVVAAASAAQIHDLIASLPEGYDTVCGDRGYRFSGGERQRLAIARALLKDARILVLDEATSSLDSTNEGLVQEALDRLMVGRTSLVIAQRLSTVRNADLIAVVDEGRIVERGTHSELTKLDGLYASMCREQQGGVLRLAV